MARIELFNRAKKFNLSPLIYLITQCLNLIKQQFLFSNKFRAGGIMYKREKYCTIYKMYIHSYTYTFIFVYLEVFAFERGWGRSINHN